MSTLRLPLALAAAALVLLAGSAGRARADETVVLDAIDSGHWSERGEHLADPSYLVGRQNGVRYVGYFVFDLSDLAGRTIRSARFNVWTPASGASFTVSRLRVPLRTPDNMTPEQFMATTEGGPLHPQVFRSIWNSGSHQDVGYYYVDGGDLDSNINFGLPYHTQRLQAYMGGLLVVGTEVTNLPAGTSDNYSFDGTTADDTKQLILTLTDPPRRVPGLPPGAGPPALLLLGVGSLGLIGYAWRRWK